MVSEKTTEAARKLFEIRARLTLEKLLVGEDYFGLTTATDLQRAICRIADGKGLEDLHRSSVVLDSVGLLPQGIGRPRELIILSGIRTGKSLFTAALAVYWTQIADVSKLTIGEVARVSVVSLTVDLARVVFGHIVGNVLGKPKLRTLLAATPTSDSVILRHPSGKPVEIKVVAGARAGASLVARWSAGLILDEAPRMIGADEGIVNYDDARSAVVGRLLPGAQIVSIGSPWAPFGPIYSAVQESWKQPTDRRVIVWAPGWEMNSVYWTEERVAALKASEPDVYITDCAAQFATPEEALFNSVDLDKCTRAGPMELPPDPNGAYVAAMDPAIVANSWTFVIATRVGSKYVIALARQWQGTMLEPLNAVDTMKQIADICMQYGVKGVYSDKFMGDALHAIALTLGISVWQHHMSRVDRAKKYMSLKTRMNDGTIELPPLPEVRSDLQRIKKRVTQNGIDIHLPSTSDGRHCDFAPSIVLSIQNWLDDVKVPLPEPGTDEALKLEVAAMRKASQAKYAPEVRRRGRRYTG